MGHLKFARLVIFFSSSNFGEAVEILKEMILLYAKKSDE